MVYQMLMDSQKTYISSGALSLLWELVDCSSVRKVALFRGGRSFANSGASAEIYRLKPKHILIEEYIVDVVNPTSQSLVLATERYMSNSADVIIAVGGGSVIDTAKCVRLFSSLKRYRSGTEIISFLDQVLDGPVRPLIAVPTTSGTGSEATPFATYYENGLKHSCEHQALLPSIVIVDGRLSKSQTDKQMASSAVDALCQAIESLWSSRATRESTDFAWEVIRLVANNLSTAISLRSPKSLQALVHAAYLSGLAISETRTTAPHAFSYALTSEYGIPHGQAVALFMGPIFQFHELSCSSSKPNLISLQRSILNTIAGPFSGPSSLVWEHKLSEWGLTPRLADLRLPAGAKKFLLKSVNQERLKNHPVVIDMSEFEELLEV